MIKRIFLLGILFLCCISCSKINELEDRVTIIESQLDALKTAYESGKIIDDVNPYQAEGKSGWTIKFSDNTSINILNGENGKDGKDGVTPVLNVDSQGFWVISYDNGATFSLLKDNEGKPFSSKGQDGISVRIAVSEDGKYVIETYSTGNPDEVLESIETDFSANQAAVVQSIVKDPYNGTISLLMADGVAYKFNLDVCFPTGIVVLAEKVILPNNNVGKFEFRVNPSNALVDLNVTQENPMFELDLINQSATRSYVTAPQNYSLERIEVAKDKDGNIIEGQYIAYVRELGLENDYCQMAALVMNTKDGKGENIQITSALFKVEAPKNAQFTSFGINGSYAHNLDDKFITVKLPYGTEVKELKPDFEVTKGTVSVNGVTVDESVSVDFSSPVEFVITDEDGSNCSYMVSIAYSALPVVYINTKDAAPIVSKDNWLKETEIYITNAGKMDDFYKKASIKGRGNSTWNYPKKPFAIKLDSKEEVLGMPKHKRWVLLANYVDKTCIRNSVAFEIAKLMDGLDWTPRGQHVDVVLNGEFMGNYYLCEQIKIDKNRVNITEMESEDIDEESITGGYLLEVDKNYDEVNKFHSPVRNMPFMIKDPDEEVLGPEQFSFIQNHVAEVENALYGEGSTTEGYLKYIDLDSFIDYWMVYELTSTGEPTHPKSVYMHKDRNGKIHAGPVWDFDYYTYQPYYKNMLINTNAVWNDRIINDPANHPKIKERWNARKDAIKEIAEEMDRQYEIVKESAEYNSKLWPLSLNINRDDALSVKDAVARMKGYYVEKVQYMDTFINMYF